MTIGMLGFGEVAQAIFERIGEHWELSIKRILSPAPRAGAGERFTDNADDILRDSEIDAVIDALEGGQPSLDCVMRALKAGKHVVSLNGEMLAAHLKELMETAQRSRVQLKVEPAVGVGAPYLSNLIRLSRVDALRCVFGTASGACNPHSGRDAVRRHRHGGPCFGAGAAHGAPTRIPPQSDGWVGLPGQAEHGRVGGLRAVRPAGEHRRVRHSQHHSGGCAGHPAAGLRLPAADAARIS